MKYKQEDQQDRQEILNSGKQRLNNVDKDRTQFRHFKPKRFTCND